MRQLQEFIEQTQFRDDIECRGMDRIATEIAQEILVFLEYDRADAGAREQKSKHDSGRAAARNTTLGAHDILLGAHASLPSLRGFAEHQHKAIRLAQRRRLVRDLIAPILRLAQHVAVTDDLQAT